MNRFLLLALSAGTSLIFQPSKANSVKENYVRKNVIPEFIYNYENAKKFLEAKDYEMFCRTYRKMNSQVSHNFLALQNISPEIDWFDMRKKIKDQLDGCIKTLHYSR